MLLFIIIITLVLSACNVSTTNQIENDTTQNETVQSTEMDDVTVPDSIISEDNLEKYNEFVKKAEEIESYSKENYESATTQTSLNTESNVVYKKWDNLLNEVYQYLKANMNKEDFSVLEADELKWIEEKEKGIEEAATEWKGGSGEPMARNSAGIKYTSERCHYLISLVQQCK